MRATAPSPPSLVMMLRAGSMQNIILEFRTKVKNISGNPYCYFSAFQEYSPHGCTRLDSRSPGEAGQDQVRPGGGARQGAVGGDRPAAGQAPAQGERDPDRRQLSRGGGSAGVRHHPGGRAGRRSEERRVGRGG